ncbi:MAG: curli assembly protein CsgF [Saprospiraceae bacterium]|nr:curli assembly protein CsgF [Saprospiraceae bacterium]
MKKLIQNIFLLFFVLFFAHTAAGQALVYTPKNPNFGGDTFNYQQLLNSANSQNDFQEASGFDDDQSDLDQFTEDLNRQLLNSISRQLFTDTFGQDGLQPGNFTFGSLSLEIFPSSEGLVINILDTQTGDQSQIIIPD